MGALAPQLRRRLIGGLIVAFWLVMVGLLAAREKRARRSPAPDGVAAIPAAAETWLGIYLDGDRPVGTLHLVTRPERR